MSKMLEVYRKNSDPVLAERVKEIGVLLEVTLLYYLNRPKADQKILEKIDSFLGKLQHSLWFGSSEKILAPYRLKEVLATLVGARMVLTPERDRHAPEEEPSYNATLAAKFLEVVSRKVGSINSETGKATILITVDPNQDGWNVIVPPETYNRF